MDDREVVLALKAGDKNAFELLYKRYWQKVYDFACLYDTSLVEIEEVVQDVFVKIWEMRTTIDEEKNFEGFLFIITRNSLFNHSRRSFNESFYRLTILEAVEKSYDIEEELETSDLRDYLDSLLELLPPRQREVFFLSREEHLTYKEIAARLQISEKTVEHHISNVLKFLRKNIQAYALFLTI